MGRIPDHLVSLAVRALENRWVTIGAKPDSKRPGKKKGGTPVELDGEGKITKGPAALTGKRPSELSQSHLFSGQDHKSQRKLFAEPGDPPPPPPIEETPKAPAPAAKKEPKPRAKKPLGMSLLAVIRREGGISSGDFEHADFKEFGLLGALNKKGLSLDDMAATMVRQGHITVPMGKSSPSDHLLQLLKKKTNSLLAADTAKYDKDYEAYMQAREEAQSDGYPEEQLAEASGRGEEAGDQESQDRLFDEIFGGDGSGGEEAGRDEEPGDLAGDSAEPAGGVDTSFDFGPAAAPKVEEKPKAKPRKPKQKKDWEDRQEEKHQKALADVKAADAEKAAVAAKARELLGKVTDPGQKDELQKLIDRAEGKQEQAPAPPAIEPKPAKKEDHEMTSAEYLRNGRPNFGDMVQTPYGKIGIMSGGGGIGSNRVKVNGVWHDHDDLKLIKRPDKDVHQNLSSEWKAKQKADLAKIDKDHGVTLHKKSMVDSAKKRLQAGTMTQDQYDKFVGTGFYKMTDDEVTQAEKAQAEIDAIKDRPLEFEQSVHSLRVANALAMGKDVPTNVLAEYPDLAKKYGKDKEQPAPAPTPIPPAVEPNPNQPPAPVAGASKPTPPKPPERRYGEKAPKSKSSNPPQDERTYSEKDKEKLVANMRRAVDSKKDPEQVVKSLKIDPTFTSKSQMKTELDLIRDNFPQVYQALKDNPGALGKDLHDEVAQHTGGQGPEAFDFDAEQVRADKAFKPGTPLDRKAPTPPPPATNLFGQPEPTKPQPATTQGLFGEQVPVEDPKVKPRETIADQAEKGLDWLDQKQDPKTDGTGEMFGGLFSPGRTSGATEPEAGPVAAPAVEPSPAATAPAPQSQSFDDYRRANGVKGYTMDHSMLSPSGRVSGRSANAARARVDKQFSDYNQAEKEYQAKVDAGGIVDPTGKYQKPDQAKVNKGEADLLRTRAKMFRSIAERGMQTRKLTRQAEELERQANELDPVAKAEAGPVAAPKVETAKPAPKYARGVTQERLDSYDPEEAISKVGKGWIVSQMSGSEFPTVYKSKGEAIQQARFHKDFMADYMAKPESFGFDKDAEDLRQSFDKTQADAHAKRLAAKAAKSQAANKKKPSKALIGPTSGDPRNKIYAKLLAGADRVTDDLYAIDPAKMPHKILTKLYDENARKRGWNLKPVETEFYKLMDRYEVTGDPHDVGYILKLKKQPTPESRTLSNIRQQLREAFRQCP